MFLLFSEAYSKAVVLLQPLANSYRLVRSRMVVSSYKMVQFTWLACSAGLVLYGSVASTNPMLAEVAGGSRCGQVRRWQKAAVDRFGSVDGMPLPTSATRTS